MSPTPGIPVISGVRTVSVTYAPAAATKKKTSVSMKQSNLVVRNGNPNCNLFSACVTHRNILVPYFSLSPFRKNYQATTSMRNLNFLLALLAQNGH